MPYLVGIFLSKPFWIDQVETVFARRVIRVHGLAPTFSTKKPLRPARGSLSAEVATTSVTS